jgi:hypothetical protein
LSSLPSPLPSVSASCLPQMPFHRQHTSHPQTQEPLQPLVCQQSRCCHLWLFTSLWLIVTLLHRHQRPPLIAAAAVIVAIASWLSPPIHTYRGIRSEEEKGRKSLFYLRHNKLKKANLDQVVSESQKQKKNYSSHPFLTFLDKNTSGYLHGPLSMSLIRTL